MITECILIMEGTACWDFQLIAQGNEVWAKLRTGSLSGSYTFVYSLLQR